MSGIYFSNLCFKALNPMTQKAFFFKLNNIYLKINRTVNLKQMFFLCGTMKFSGIKNLLASVGFY